MHKLLGIIIATIFVLLALIHVYWVLGGKTSMEYLVPQKKDGKPNFKPSKISTLAIAFGLMIFAAIILIKSELINLPDWNWLANYGTWIISIIFLLRAIGDFKYIGFFKQVKNSKFAKMDSRFYCPICLFIALSGLFLAFF